MEIGDSVLKLIGRGVEEESEILAPVLVLVAHVLKRVASDAVVYIAVDAETGGDEQRPEKAGEKAPLFPNSQPGAHKLEYRRNKEHQPQRAREGPVSADKAAKAKFPAPHEIDAACAAQQEQPLAHRSGEEEGAGQHA